VEADRASGAAGAPEAAWRAARVPDRVAMAGILYRVRTGCQWKALPPEFGSGSTCHLRMMQWVRAGVFVKMHAELLRHYDKRRGIKWDFASLDSAMAKAPKGGALRAEPDGSRETRVKRHVLTDGRGVPLAVLITGANVHDKWMVADVLDAVVLRAPRATTPGASLPGQGLRLCRRGSRRAPSGIIPHIRRRGEPPLLGCVRGTPDAGRRTNHQLAQPLPGVARALGAPPGPLPRDAPARLWTHRVSTGSWVLGRALSPSRTEEGLRCSRRRTNSWLSAMPFLHMGHCSGV